MTDEKLERRYRRLLAVYPWEHRRAYEEEMLAVLLAGARPGQTRPDAADALDLVGGGLRARARAGARQFTAPAWVDAAAVTGLLAALLLLASAAKDLADRLVPNPDVLVYVPPTGADLLDWLRVAGWLAVAVATLLGWLWLAAGLAWTAVAAWGVLVGRGLLDQPGFTVSTLPQLTLALMAATALTVPTATRRAVSVLGVRRLVALVLAPLAGTAVLELSRLSQASTDLVGAVPVHVFYGLLGARSEALLWLYVAVLAGAGLVLLVSLATLAPPVRVRVLVALSPLAALALVMDNMHTWPGSVVPLDAGEVALLVLAPLTTFLAGVLLVRRREETRRLLALGRAADRN
ncbi:hypothetical protein [Micromonospora auratinigra]|uniref:Uncharacterized protein n=1 Tax=Micromonospora auratinigra TaxID=261654 RepID=A0A1A8ZB21_9ACTN|nr:hypothetical protein [Micromonospora auratinigra]SBT41032.1 hypothetical protein GA0070611_1473 [Micromonospora auratinigra]